MSDVEVNQSYECIICGYIYDPAEGDPENDVTPGTSFEDLPHHRLCHECAAGKDQSVHVE